MPWGGQITNDDLDNPDYKAWAHGWSLGGGGRPGGSAGSGGWGGSGMFLTSPTYGGAATPMTGARRRVPTYGTSLAPQDTYAGSGLTTTVEGPSTTPSGGMYVDGELIGPSGLTPTQERALAGYPAMIREAVRRQLLALNQRQATPGSGQGGNYDPYGAMAGGGASNWGQLMNMLLGQGGQAGYFSPGGSQDVMNSIKSRFTTASGDAERKARTLAMLANPDDPSAAGYGAMKASLNNASDSSRALDSALLSERQKYEDWVRQLMGQNFQFNMENYLAGLNRNNNGQGRGMGISLGPVGFHW